jgi:UDP-N-acetylmuramoylalanine--D-glutamate ligase
VLVVGLGSSGLAAARLAAADGSEVWATDLRPETDLATEVAALGGNVRTFLGGHPESCLDGVDLVIASPGVPADAKLLEAARGRKIQINTEIEFAWRHRPQAQLVAVTGSNGKSTVTESWVLEVSSFQAELLTEMTPRVAVFLNLSQDHLERHPDLESYFAAKQRLFALQGETDTAVLNADDPVVAATRTAAWKRLFSTAGTADAYLDGDELVLDGEAIIRSTEVRLSGIHNLANALAAALAAATLGAPSTAMAATLSTFDGLAHRHRTVHIADGVRWVDDSKATNVGATLAALRGYPDRSLHLILGGQAKGQDFSVLVGEMRRAVARLYLIGEDGPAIGEALGDAAPIENCGSLAEAVGRARGHAISGEWVLLAPACASFDQFSNYGERGDCFADLARQEVASCP